MKNEGELSTGCCIYQKDVYIHIYTCIKTNSLYIVYMVMHMMIYDIHIHGFILMSRYVMNISEI